MNRASKREFMDVVVGLPSASLPAAPAAVAAGSPGGDPPSSARMPGQLDNPWFWSIYPKRVNAAAADRLLTELLVKGVSRALLEAGAQAYADHVRRQHLSEKYVAAPLNWLRGERWVDSFNDSETASRGESKQQKAPGKRPKRALETRSASGMGVADTKPAKATKPPKPRPVETPEGRAQRLAGAKAKRAEDAARWAHEKARKDAEREAQLEAQRQVQVARHKEHIQSAMQRRDEFVAALEAEGMEKNEMPKWVALALQKTCSPLGAFYHESKHRYLLENAFGKAVSYQGSEDKKDEQMFLEWFAGRSYFGHYPMMTLVPKVIKWRTIWMEWEAGQRVGA